MSSGIKIIGNSAFNGCSGITNISLKCTTPPTVGSSNFTNKVIRDIALIHKGRLGKPLMVIAYSKDQSDWYTIYEGNIICPYNGEKKNIVAMKRYINNQFLPEVRDAIIEQEDVRAFKYKDIYTQTTWRKNMELIKK